MKYLLLLLLLGSCSHFKKEPSLSDSAAESAKVAPAWLYSPYDGCSEAVELCATGEGKTFTQAEAEARANLGSIFEIKIQSELNVTTSGTQTFPWQAEVKEEVQKSIKESVEQILETVQIKQKFRKDGLSHALASLDRQKASELIGNRLMKVDGELETLWENHQRTNLRRIVKLFLERERLNERYSIVSGSARPSKVTWQNIIQWRESKPKAEPLLLKIGQAPDWMKEKLAELFTEAGFHLVKGDARKIVTVQVDSIKEFLNIAGFEKHTFTLSMSSIVNGERKRTISTSETVTGRSQADALLKVKSFFNDYIEQHLSDLRLD
jgi:hypothetical protein